jgi:hypothetical protein
MIRSASLDRLSQYHGQSYRRDLERYHHKQRDMIVHEDIRSSLLVSAVDKLPYTMLITL